MFQKIRTSKRFAKSLFIGLMLLSITPLIGSAIALFAGIVFALLFENPYPQQARKGSKMLLQVSVVGLGFGMNLHEALQTGLEGMAFTITSVVLIMILGVLIGKWIKLSKRASYLIAAGTAICGGSAIAAISPIIRSNEVETSVSLATVFTLNAVGLLIFPYMGHLLGLSQHQFGLWAAIAIHDTSSVVGAGSAYGNEALQVATTVKLTRALWIIPLAFVSTFVFRDGSKKINVPWFIFFFILAMIISTYLPIPTAITESIVYLSKRLLTLTLFLIGAGLTRSALTQTGYRPLVLGITLWIVIGVISLIAVLQV